MSVKKVGGIRFARLGRYQFSFCVCKRKQITHRLYIAGVFYQVYTSR